MRHLRLAGCAAIAALAGCGLDGDPSALAPRGQGAAEVTTVWWYMFWCGLAVYLLVVALVARSLLRRRRAEPAGREDPADTEHRDRVRLLLAGGVVLPLVVLLPLAAMEFRTASRLSPAAAGEAELRIEVVGHMFWWEIRYPDHQAVTANELHVPVGQRVLVELTSEDVIHSFWVPSLHPKIDTIPGERTEMWLEATEEGEFRGVCAEFCGIQHANMHFLVIAQPPDEFEAWLARQAADAEEADDDLVEEGAEAFAALGCAACHTVRGTEADGAVGPDLTHLASRRTLGAGIVANNRGNLGGWIVDPQSIKPGNPMPPTPMEAGELRSLLAYLESLE